MAGSRGHRHRGGQPAQVQRGRLRGGLQQVQHLGAGDDAGQSRARMRAGADQILTYFAPEAARLLK